MVCCSFLLTAFLLLIGSCDMPLMRHLVVQAKNDKPVHLQPEQIHLSLGTNINQWVVTWTTINRTTVSTVWYGVGRTMNIMAKGAQNLFTDGGPAKRQMYIHRVYLNDLLPNTSYQYHCGSTQGWSEIFYFNTFPQGNEWSPRFVVYGDLGNVEGRTLGRLQNEVQQGQHDLILHVGDFAYNLEDDDAKVGDEFMRQIEPMAAYVPYQVCPGNHESAYNFSNYVNRFTMHTEGGTTYETNNHYWSYNIGPVHLVAFSTEFHYFTQYGTEQVRTQLRWLERDLLIANRPENRAKQPWIITMGHRPIYTQGYINQITKNGNQYGAGFEELFYKYGVDLEIWGHEHIYERIWPIYNETIFNGTTDEPYRNPQAPVHITTGSAGCKLSPSAIRSNRPKYSAFALNDYSFTHMHVINSTHLHLQQISDDKEGKVVDEIYLIKEKHGSYN